MRVACVSLARTCTRNACARAPTSSAATRHAVQVRTVDPAIAAQLDGAPALLNLARTLAFHKQQLAASPLPAAAAAQQREHVTDLTEMLRTIMCL
jgi:hypothetical protein